MLQRFGITSYTEVTNIFRSENIFSVDYNSDNFANPKFTVSERITLGRNFCMKFYFLSLSISKIQIMKMFVVITMVIIAFCGNKTDNKTARVSLLTIKELMIG